MTLARPAAVLIVALASACTNSIERSEPIAGSGTPELAFARVRLDNPHNQTEVRVASRRGLAPRKILDKQGVESGVRINPDGVRITYAREREIRDEQSREIYVASLDGSTPETRLTGDRFADDRPCWSPDGERILFSSGRLGQGRRLWIMGVDGQDRVTLHDDGTEQLDADWSAAAGDEIVFTRIDLSQAQPRARLWRIDSGGRIPVQLTDGGTGPGGSEPPGDYEPAYSPDGQRVVFSRAVTDGVRHLMLVDIDTGAITELTPALGEDRYPRFSPRGDRLLFARSRALEGMPGLRLYEANTDGSEPLMIFLDQRYAYPGCDPYPDLAPVPSGPSELADVDIGEAVLEIVLGSPTRGQASSILRRDGDVLGLATVPFGGRERAGIDIQVGLPVQSAEEVMELHITVLAALTELSPTSVLRLSLDNAVENRSDTVVELAPTDGSLVELHFATQSLAHISSDRKITLKVIADLDDHAPGELLIDVVEARIRRPVSGQ